jgi:restriction endonuclease
LALENQITLARFIKEYLSDPSKGSELIPSNTGVRDVNVEGQINEYNETLLKRNMLIANSSEKNPVVMDLNNTLTAMRQTIIRAIDNLIVGLNIQIRNTKEREVQTVKRITAVPSQQKSCCRWNGSKKSRRNCISTC